MSGKSDKEKAEMIMKSRPGMEEAMQQADEDSPIKGDKMMKLDSILGTINFPLLIGMFIFYFLGGYLLYSALFAAIGAAVDSKQTRSSSCCLSRYHSLLLMLQLQRSSTIHRATSPSGFLSYRSPRRL